MILDCVVPVFPLSPQHAHSGCSQEVVADGRRVEPRAPQVSSMEGDLDRLKKERDQLAMQLSSAQQAEGLLKQDKNYLGRQVAEVSRRADQAEDRLQQLTRQLDHARQTREEVYEKYVTCRNLREARDTALAERERLQAAAREMATKCEELTTHHTPLTRQAPNMTTTITTLHFPCGADHAE
ncbi:hypothetical protein ACOMHN_040602 [Nucella lapillus]